MNAPERLEPRRLFAAGDVDTTFGDGGIIREPAPDIIDVDDTLMMSDGKIVIAGDIRSDDDEQYLVRRYNTDGTPDTTFGVNGTAAGHLGGLTARIRQIELGPDGTLMAVGFQDEPGDGFPITAFVMRLDADGALDTSFSDDGFDTATLEVGEILDVAVDDDGRVYFVHEHVVTRYTSGGDIDTTFADGGSLHSDGFFHKVLPLADGSLLIDEVFQEEPADAQFVVTRHNADGSTIASFGDDGKLTLPFYAYFATELPGGKVLWTGENPDDSGTRQFARRYDANGNLDTTFGDNGETSVTQNGSSTRPLVDSAGRIYLTGYTGNVTRLTPDGDPDPTFGKIYSYMPNFLGQSAGVWDDHIVFAGATTEFFPDREAEFTLFARLTEDDGNPSPITLSAGAMIANGTDDADYITLRDWPFTGAAINGFGRGFDNDEVDSVLVNANDGDDIIVVGEFVARGMHIKGGSGRDRIAGGKGNDTLEGNAQRDFLDGGDGDDLIVGNGGRDQMRGENGNDSLGGGRGNDYIEGNDGNDHLEGGPDNDILHGDAGTDSAKEDDDDILDSIETVVP